MSTIINIENKDGLEYLDTIENNSIDLILTDPPYIISRESGMNTHFNNVQKQIEDNIEFVKTEEEWKKYKKKIILKMMIKKIIICDMVLYMVKNIV